MTVKNIFLTDHHGMVSSAVYKHLINVSSSYAIIKNRSEVDLLDCTSVDNFFRNKPIDIVIHAVAKAAGISAVKNKTFL